MSKESFLKNHGVKLSIANSNLQMPFFHLHDGYEIYLLLRGERSYFIEDDLVRLHDGEIALIKPYTLHKTGGKHGHRVLFEINNSFLKRYFTDEAIKTLSSCFNITHRATNKEQLEKITSIFSDMLKLDEREEIDEVFMLVAELFKTISACPPATERQTQSEQLVTSITEYVNRKYAEIKGVEDTAEHFYINKCYLCRIFKKVTGLSFISYLNNIKLGHAAELLVSSSKEISEIALLCGFNSTAYFCNVFKDEFGITPRAYRVANNYYSK